MQQYGDAAILGSRIKSYVEIDPLQQPFNQRLNNDAHVLAHQAQSTDLVLYGMLLAL
jgi:hypothetical protein